MASATPIPFVIPQFFTDAGEMASFYQLFTYQIESTTKQDTFADSAQTTVNDNPIVLDQYGRAPIFLSLTSYKFVLATPTASDPPAPADIVWTADNVPAYSTGFVNFDITGVAGEDTDTDNNVVYLSDGSDSKTPGLWYLTNALSDFSSSTARTLGVAIAPINLGETGTIRIAGRASITVNTLTVGALYYLSDASDGRVTSTPPAQNVTVLGKADSTSTLIIEPAWGFAGAATRGLMNFSGQIIGGQKTFSVQPQTSLGTSAATPRATIGGQFYSDLVEHSLPANTGPTVMTDTTIPANMLDADGKGLEVWFGSTTANAGSTTDWRVSINVGGTTNTIMTPGTNLPCWMTEMLLIRLDSDSLVLTTYYRPNGQQIFQINGLDFTSPIVLQTIGETDTSAPGASTMSQTFFVMQALG